MLTNLSKTTDIWSSKLSADSYIGVTAHFINKKEGKRQWLKISKWFLSTSTWLSTDRQSHTVSSELFLLNIYTELLSY